MAATEILWPEDGAKTAVSANPFSDTAEIIELEPVFRTGTLPGVEPSKVKGARFGYWPARRFARGTNPPDDAITLVPVDSEVTKVG